MRFAALLLLCLLPLHIGAAEHSGDGGRFTITAPDDWTFLDDPFLFVLRVPGGGMLSAMDAPPLWDSDALEVANDNITSMSFMLKPGSVSNVRKVSGKGWKGILQRQFNALGQQELQLVARSSKKTYVFKFGAPLNSSPEQLEGFEKVMLSLKVK